LDILKIQVIHPQAQECEYKSYTSKTKSSAYAIGLINGLGNKSLCAKKGIMVDQGGEGTYLQGEKKVKSI
jgi:hypothetical protein